MLILFTKYILILTHKINREKETMKKIMIRYWFEFTYIDAHINTQTQRHIKEHTQIYICNLYQNIYLYWILRGENKIISKDSQKEILRKIFLYNSHNK